MKISIVVPSLNQARFIEKALLSIFDQDFPGAEVIVVDGQSNDDTLNILHKYDKRISHWVSEPDDGQADALVKGFRKATGDILCWLCSDDLLEPGALQFVGRYFASHPTVDWIYGDAIWIDLEGSPLRWKKEIPFSQFIWVWDHNFIPQPSTFWRRSLYEAVGGVDPHYQCAMDADLFARFLKFSAPRHVRRVLSRIRYYPEQKNQRLRALSDSEDLNIRHTYLNRNITRFELGAKRLVAKGLRVALKIALGCYFPQRHNS